MLTLDEGGGEFLKRKRPGEEADALQVHINLQESS